MARKILVPTDGSESANAALEFTMNVHPDAEITIIHAIDAATTRYDEVGIRPPVGKTREERLEKLEEKSAELLEDVKSKTKDHAQPVQTETIVGRPQDVIIDYAVENDFDQIIMGSRGRSGAARVLLGSVSERVVRGAPIPVTIVD